MLMRMLLALIVVALSNPVWANPEPPEGTYFYDLIVDTDNDPATGCETHVQDDNIDINQTGIERIIRAKVVFECPGPKPVVTELDRLDCDPDTGIFSHTVYDNGNWDVGLNNGVDGGDVIEALVPLAAVNLSTAAAKIIFRATGPTPNSDVLLNVDGTADSNEILLVRWTSAPTVSQAWLLLATVLLIAFGTWTVRRRAGRTAAVAVAVIAVVTSGALTAWAGGITLDGMVEDWAGIEQLGNDVLNDSTKDDDGEDIVAGFAIAAMDTLYFRIDVKNLERPGCDP